jgi:hypothetical protein
LQGVLLNQVAELQVTQGATLAEERPCCYPCSSVAKQFLL